MRAFLALSAGLALIAGFLLFPLAERTEDSFSWTIEPPPQLALEGDAQVAHLLLTAHRDQRRLGLREHVLEPRDDHVLGTAVPRLELALSRTW